MFEIRIMYYASKIFLILAVEAHTNHHNIRQKQQNKVAHGTYQLSYNLAETSKNGR